MMYILLIIAQKKKTATYRLFPVFVRQIVCWANIMTDLHSNVLTVVIATSTIPYVNPIHRLHIANSLRN